MMVVEANLFPQTGFPDLIQPRNVGMMFCCRKADKLERASHNRHPERN